MQKNILGLMLVCMACWSISACRIEKSMPAAAEGSNIIGTWIEPVPGMPSMIQGFVLTENGRASSVNMATLRYEKWERKNNSLILSGKSIGNRQTIPFTKNYIIEELTADTLVLKDESQSRKFGRQPNACR